MTIALNRTAKSSIDFFGCAGDYAELSAAMLDRTAAVLASGRVLGGPDVAMFEAQVATLASREHAVAVGSGTDALFFALLGAGIHPGDEVLVPAISFVASASAILRVGARPVFVDIGPDIAIDLDRAAQQITPATRALVHVHLFGAMNDPEAPEQFAAQHGIALVEDYAQSFGSSYAGRPAGSLGIASAASFDPTKVIGAPGSGGALVTDDPAIAARARRLRLHGRNENGFVELGFNSQLSSVGAAILNLKLERHGDWTQRRTAIATRYISALADLPIALPPVDPQVMHVWHKFIVLTEQRDALAMALKAQGIPFRVHYDRPLPKEQLFGIAQKDADFPNAFDYCRRTLSLPIHSHLGDDEVDHVIAAIRAFFA